MQIKIRPRQGTNKKPKFIYGVEQELDKAKGRLPQLNKFYNHRRIYG